MDGKCWILNFADFAIIKILKVTDKSKFR
jgi:hypothetical protein